MTRGARIAIASLAVLLALCIGVGAYVWVAQRASMAEWALQDAEYKATVDRLVQESRDKNKAGALMDERIEELETEKDGLLQELTKVKAKRRQRVMPTSLRECTDQLAEAEGEIALRERTMALDALTIEALRGALLNQKSRANLLEKAWTMERERSEGWSEYSRKHKRRNRVKIAFTAIGSAAAGGLAGYAVGVTR